MKSIEQMKYELRNKLLKALPPKQTVATTSGYVEVHLLHPQQTISDIDNILGEFFDEPEPKKTVTTYSTIISKGNAFTEAINSMARQGWKPHGNLVIRNSHELVQLMVKETEVQF